MLVISPCPALLHTTTSRLDHFVPLLPSLQSLDSLPVHGLCHLLEPLLLRFSFSLILECLRFGLRVSIIAIIEMLDGFTSRSASFSSFISFSLAFTAAIACLSALRFSQLEFPAFGLNAFFGSCHCFPKNASVILDRRACLNVPFFRMPCGAGLDVACMDTESTSADIVIVTSTFKQVNCSMI